MNWTMILLAIVTGLYTLTAISYTFTARPAMGLAFLGYVIANIGLIWDAYSK